MEPLPDQSATPRYTIDTVLGPIKVVPECKVQAVCVNGLKCWEAGRCLRDPAALDEEQP